MTSTTKTVVVNGICKKKDINKKVFVVEHSIDGKFFSIDWCCQRIDYKVI